jgi:phthalate 4,5-cis-dihydrodiol dehydrogenase
MSERKLKIGVAGLGRAFQLMLPTFIADPRISLAAAADPRAEARRKFASDFAAETFLSVEEMCANSSADVIYVATPHQYHVDNVVSAARAKKHVLVEKPMALTIEDCQTMIEAARRAGVCMVIGHSHSFDAPVRRARELIASGAFGALRMVSAINYTDFLYRPRRPEELATQMGGGVVFNQAPHQIDILRFLAGPVKSVRAAAGAWDRERPTEGAYGAFLSFEGGAFATITYSGYAHFDSDELTDWIAESGYRKDPGAYGTARAALRGISAAAELELKHARNFAGSESGISAPAGPRSHQHFGLAVVSCDRADLKITPRGVAIYDDFGVRFEEPPDPVVPRAAVIDELHGAIVSGQSPLHDGHWGLATMEVCLAILQSSREGREIALTHQLRPGASV